MGLAGEYQLDLDPNALLRLAQEPSSEKRRELLRAVTDMFMQAPAAHSTESMELFGDVMRHVVDQVDVGARSELAERVAPVDHTPRILVRRLASDESIAVAGPVLRESSVLTDGDLMEIAETKGDDHLLALTGRRSLGSPVTDVIIRRGSQPVLHGLTANPGMKISERGARRLVEHAEDDNALQRNLFARTDLPPDCSTRVKKMVRGEKLPKAPPVVDEITRYAESVIAEFSKASGMHPDNIRGMVTGPKIEPVIIIGRALALTETQFELVLRYRLRTPGRVGSELINALQRFQTLPVPTAQRVMRFLRARNAANAA